MSENFTQSLRFLRANGIYVFATHAIGQLRSLFRNRLLAGKLGVKTLNIGSRSRLRGLSSIELGEGFVSEAGLWLEALTLYKGQEFSPLIRIGKHVHVSQFVHIAATHRVEIGDHVMMGSRVTITDHNHGQYSTDHTPLNIAPALRPLDRNLSVIIGHNVWLGDGVVVTAGASIGEGTVIGANSVVVGSIPAYSIAAGNPAKVHKTYDRQTLQWTKSA